MSVASSHWSFVETFERVFSPYSSHGGISKQSTPEYATPSSGPSPQCLLCELRQNEGSFVDLLRIVLEEFVLFIAAQCPCWLPHIPFGIFGANHEPHLPAWICRDRSPGVISDWEDSLAVFLQWLDDVHVKPWVLACAICVRMSTARALYNRLVCIPCVVMIPPSLSAELSSSK